MRFSKKELHSRFSFDGLYSILQTFFHQLEDPRSYGSHYDFQDLLRMAFAMFSLKSPSMYSFQRRSQAEFHNLQHIFGITQLCSDNCLRQGLDELLPNLLSGGFVLFYQLLNKYHLLTRFRYWRKRKLLSIDGVEHFHSKKVHCSSCLAKEEKNGEIHYSHSMLVGALVHPEQAVVFPLGAEPILRQDGQEKNDCELNAVKRLVKQLSEAYPAERFVILEDALYANGPHIELLDQYKYSYIIGVKPNSHESLFRHFERRIKHKPADRLRFTDERETQHVLMWARNLPLNTSRADIRVNMLYYEQINIQGKKTIFSWVTDLKVVKRNAIKIMRAGRTRWKIENETFNTLKNQGYAFEHNFGHGNKHLATVFALMMLLAFTLDQVQQHASKLFIQLWKGLKTRQKLWQAIRAAVVMIKVQNMEQLFRISAEQYQIKIDSS